MQGSGTGILTLCPRSLDPYCMLSYSMKHTSWTNGAKGGDPTFRDPDPIYGVLDKDPVY